MMHTDPNTTLTDAELDKALAWIDDDQGEWGPNSYLRCAELLRELVARVRTIEGRMMPNDPQAAFQPGRAAETGRKLAARGYPGEPADAVPIPGEWTVCEYRDGDWRVVCGEETVGTTWRRELACKFAEAHNAAVRELTAERSHIAKLFRLALDDRTRLIDERDRLAARVRELEAERDAGEMVIVPIDLDAIEGEE